MAKIDPVRDLARLVAPQTSFQGMRFSQGTILTWNPATFENTVDWKPTGAQGGITLTNLPILGRIDGLSLKAGDVVGLMGWAPNGGFGSWWILGELAVPPLMRPAAIEGGAELLVLSEANNRWTALRNGQIEFGRITPEGTDNALSSIFTENQDIFLLASFNAFIRGGNQTLVDAVDGHVFVQALGAGRSLFLDADDVVDVDCGGDFSVSAATDIELISATDEVRVTSPTTGFSANVVLTTSPAIFRRETSAARFKQDIRDFCVNPRTVLDLKPRTWRDRGDVEENPDSDRWHVGFVAEEVEDAGLGAFVNYDHEGEPNVIAYNRLCVALLEVVKDQDRRLAELESRVATLDGRAAATSTVETTELPKRLMDPPPERRQAGRQRPVPDR